MKKLENILINGGIAIIPTDTIYGIVARALDEQTVSKVYTIKNRTPSKPFIILISSLKDLSLFGIDIDKDTIEFLNKNWPGKLSVILPLAKVTPWQKFEYLHRGTNTLAFRIPNKKDLIDLLKKTGPLIAPSANPEGEKTAETILEARKYFGDAVDMYVDGGKLIGEPSTLVKMQDGKVEILRQGSVRI